MPVRLLVGLLEDALADNDTATVPTVNNAVGETEYGLAPVAEPRL
jgi:hypothetical protein